jgi:hypothetical protein
MMILRMTILASTTMRLAVNIFLLYKKQIEGKFVVANGCLMLINNNVDPLK